MFVECIQRATDLDMSCVSCVCQGCVYVSCRVCVCHVMCVYMHACLCICVRVRVRMRVEREYGAQESGAGARGGSVFSLSNVCRTLRVIIFHFVAVTDRALNVF